MSELILTSKEDLEKMFIRVLSQYVGSNQSIITDVKDERLNQKQAAEYLGVTEATIIRYKKAGKLSYHQLPGSSKVTFFKSVLRAEMQRNRKVT